MHTHNQKLFIIFDDYYDISELFAKLRNYIAMLKTKQNFANLVDESSFMKAYNNLNRNLKMIEASRWQILLLLKVIVNILILYIYIYKLSCITFNIIIIS